MPERKDGPQQPTREEFLGKMSPLEKKTITRLTSTLMTIARKIEGTHTIEVLSKLPDSYNLGETKGKGLVRLTPKYADSQRPIDIVYIREVDLGNSSLEDFEEKDVDEGGEPLPKVLLASAEVHQFRFFDES